MPVQTANFLQQGPTALEAQALSQEQALLLQRLQEQQQNLTPQTTDAGRFRVLNFEGLGNAIASSRTQDKLETNRKKQADLLGAHQKMLLEELARYDSKDPEHVRRGLVSTNPSVKTLAERDAKLADEEAKAKRDRLAAGLKELLARGSLPSAVEALQANDPSKLAPRENQTVSNGMVFGTTENAPPRVIAGRLEDPKMVPGAGVGQRNPFTNEVDIIDKAPKTSVRVDAGGKAGVKFLETEAETLSKQGQTLRTTVPQQLSALTRAEETAASGAMQGPVSGLRSLAVGLARELGLTGEALTELLANTQTLDSDMGKFVLANVKLLGANPSNADREYSERTAGGKQLSPEGLAAVIRAAKADILTAVNMHNSQVNVLLPRLPDAEIARVRLPVIVNGPRKSADEISLPGFTLSKDGRWVKDLPGGGQGAALSPQEAANKAKMEALGLPYTPPGK